MWKGKKNKDEAAVPFNYTSSASAIVINNLNS